MSRIGQKTIQIPDKVEVTIEDGNVQAKGPLGEMSLDFPPELSITKTEDNEIQVEPKKKRKRVKAMWGLYRSLLYNIVHGVSEGFEKKLEIEGVGYRAEVKGNELVLHLGYSHPVHMEIPEGLNVQVEKSVISISGMDKQLVGQFAADVRAKRKPEPYKGKGIHYEDEQVRRKAGKRAVTGTGA